MRLPLVASATLTLTASGVRASSSQAFFPVGTPGVPWGTAERAEWLAKVEPLTVSSNVETVTGLEFWFTLPGHAAVKPPPPWKMALVTVLGLFPLVLWLVPLLGQAFSSLPGPLATLATVGVMVSLMTWGIMPMLIRIFRPWLFGRAP